MYTAPRVILGHIIERWLNTSVPALTVARATHEKRNRFVIKMQISQPQAVFLLAFDDNLVPSPVYQIRSRLMVSSVMRLLCRSLSCALKSSCQPCMGEPYAGTLFPVGVIALADNAVSRASSAMANPLCLGLTKAEGQ